jgi:hypothetical protein
METLNKANRDEISFISFIIPKFAAAYKMNIQKAYQYLKQYGGIDYLRKQLIIHFGQYAICLKFVVKMEV